MGVAQCRLLLAVILTLRSSDTDKLLSLASSLVTTIDGEGELAICTLKETVTLLRGKGCYQSVQFPPRRGRILIR